LQEKKERDFFNIRNGLENRGLCDFLNTLAMVSKAWIIQPLQVSVAIYGIEME
jgi:hypothetical protein